MMQGGVEHEGELVETFYHPWSVLYGESCGPRCTGGHREPQKWWEHRTVNFYKKAHSLIKEVVPNVANMIHAQGRTGVSSAKTDIFVCGTDDPNGNCEVLANLSVKMAGKVLLSSAGGKGTANILQKVYRSLKGKAPEANTLPYFLESLVPQYVDEDEYDEWKAATGDFAINQLHDWLDEHELWAPLIAEMLSGKQQYRDNKDAIATHLFCAGHPTKFRAKSQPVFRNVRMREATEADLLDMMITGQHVGAYCVPITNKLAKSMLKNIKVRLFNKARGSAWPGVRRPSIAIDLLRNWRPTV